MNVKPIYTKKLLRQVPLWALVLVLILTYILNPSTQKPLTPKSNDITPAQTDIPALTPANTPGNTTDQLIMVKRVVDGDTVELDDGHKLRYIGIDTPESVDPRRIQECFGKEAADKNREYVEGKTVRMEKDVSETDRYGRLLRYVYVNDQLINEMLVREGYAVASSYPPDIKYQERFRQAEQEARNNKRGLWGTCRIQ